MADYSRMAKALCMTFSGKGGQQVVELLESGYRGEFVALRILRESRLPLLAGDLAKKMNVSTARVAALIRALARKKYLRHARAQSDGRKVVLELTELGRQALEEREREVWSFTENALMKLTPEEAAQFVAAAQKLFD